MTATAIMWMFAFFTKLACMVEATELSDRPSVMMTITCSLNGRGEGRKTCCKATCKASARFVDPPRNARFRTALAAGGFDVCSFKSNINRARVEYCTKATRTALGPMFRLSITTPRKLVKISQSDWMILELSSIRNAMSSDVLQNPGDRCAVAGSVNTKIVANNHTMLEIPTYLCQEIPEGTSLRVGFNLLPVIARSLLS